jgi:hypothetical protein
MGLEASGWASNTILKVVGSSEITWLAISSRNSKGILRNAERVVDLDVPNKTGADGFALVFVMATVGVIEVARHADF